MRRRHMTKRLTKIEGGVSAWNPVSELWILRLLVKGGAWKAIDNDNVFTSYDRIENRVRGTQAFIDRMEKLSTEFRKTRPEEDLTCQEYSAKLKYFCEAKLKGAHSAEQTPPELVKALNECEEETKTVKPFTETFERNLNLIADLFELEPAARDVLAFFLLVKQSTELQCVCNLYFYGDGCGNLFAEVAACALALPVQTVRKALSKSGLPSTGLVQYNNRQGDEIDDLLEFDDLLTSPKMLFSQLTEEEVLASRFSIGKDPELELSDFSHIKRVETLLLPYLKQALAENRTGVNVLLYGEPGTGKTQLSRVLGQALDARIYEVGVDAEDDISRFRRSDTSRLDFWRSAGKLLRRKKRAILTIDEAEDIFSTGVSFFGFSTGNNYLRENKALINNLLEANPCPTIWMTNSLKAMDASMIRRFDIVLEVSQPTIGQRRKIIDKLAGDTLSEELCERLSRTSQLSPAVITRSLKVADAVTPTAGVERDELIASLVDDTLKAQGAETLAGKMGAIDAVYSLKYVNADADLQEVIDGIRERGSARLCLYGPPGTGKSAYAAWLAKELNKPLIVKRASDLLNCYLGMTEANIARAFREAQADGAVLLIDEADSFLQDRNGAHHSWEVTQVNEMLTQIEKYEGILIATTNLIDTLDEASIRRFDLKVKFEALTQSQSQELFEDYVEKLGLKETLTDADTRRARDLSLVAPGDFAAVVRQSKFRKLKSAADFVKRLEAECGLKSDNKHRRIGFA